MMNTEEKTRFLRELTLNLQHKGLTVKEELEDGLLPVELDGQRLCFALDTGGIRYWKEDVEGDIRSAALDRVADIVRTTAEYMSRIEAAPQLGIGPKGDYRLLADFNDVVLAGHPTRYGVEFITWERVQEGTALHQGNYYGPGVGADSYAAAKQGFAARSGLIAKSALFTPEQLTEVYRSIHETLGGEYPITAERRKLLESAARQIEDSVPDLDERVNLSNQAELDAPDNGGMELR